MISLQKKVTFLENKAHFLLANVTFIERFVQFLPQVS